MDIDQASCGLREYFDGENNCTSIHTRIINGRPADPGEFPYQARLRFKTQMRTKHGDTASEFKIKVVIFR